MNPKLWERLALFCITLIMGFIAFQSSRWSTSIDTLSISVNALNTKMEVVVNEIGHTAKQFIDINQKDIEQDKAIDSVKERVLILEHEKL